jgi:predicted regulator of Ras-like GTPase activity (Roadblock/LC7/MglB family)
MNSEASQTPERDMDVSGFSEILKGLFTRHPSVEVAVFYDNLGETIDYYSRIDPFKTRLTAAHIGLVFDSALSRCKWLEMGTVEMIEIETKSWYIATATVAEGCYLTVVKQAGVDDGDIAVSLKETMSALAKEAGF